MNYKRTPALAISLLVTLLACPPETSGAEMRSFALAGLNPAGGLPLQSGVSYTLPRTRVRIAVTLVVDKITKTTEERANDGSVTTAQAPPQFEIVVDTTNPPELTLTSEDDPNLAFYLVSDGGFLTEITDGAIAFFEGSSRISSIGVKYEDKKAEAIAGTLKLLGDVAGNVLAGLGPMSASATKVTTKRERMEGISVKLEDAFNLVDKLNNIGTTNFVTTINLSAPVSKLIKQVGERLHSEGVEIFSHPFVTRDGKAYGVDSAQGKLVDSNGREVDIPKMELEISATAVMRVETAEQLVSSSPEHTKVGGQNRKYVPGVVYRTPGEGTMRLTYDGRGVAEKRQRISEAGKTGWIELSSKVFAKVSPAITFRADGGLNEYKFATTPKYAEALKVLEQANTSAKSLMDQLKAAETNAALAEATKALKLEKLRFEVAEKQAGIIQLEAQLGAAAADARAPIEVSLRKAKGELAQLELRLQWLEKGVEVGP